MAKTTGPRFEGDIWYKEADAQEIAESLVQHDKAQNRWRNAQAAVYGLPLPFPDDPPTEKGLETEIWLAEIRAQREGKPVDPIVVQAELLASINTRREILKDFNRLGYREFYETLDRRKKNAEAAVAGLPLPFPDDLPDEQELEFAVIKAEINVRRAKHNAQRANADAAVAGLPLPFPNDLPDESDLEQAVIRADSLERK